MGDKIIKFMANIIVGLMMVVLVVGMLIMFPFYILFKGDSK